MTIENCNMNAKVEATYQRLVGADSHSIRDVFDSVYDDMQGSTRQDRMQFVHLLNQRLELSGKLPQVLVATGQYEFDKINDGHSRIKDGALKDKAKEFHNEDRLLEESLVNDMLSSENLMKKERHEGQFLGMGNKGGVDLARLEAHVDKTSDRISAERVLQDIGTDRNWQDITQGTGYLTAPYINHRLNQNLITHDLSPDQEYALRYLNDKNNFKHASKDVPVAGYGDNTTYERRVTQTSLENYVGKKWYGTGYEYVNDDPQTGVRDRQGAGWRAWDAHNRQVADYRAQQSSVDEACANPTVSEVQPAPPPRPRPEYRRPQPAQDNCRCTGEWSDDFTN
jgi:hypothetical protein